MAAGMAIAQVGMAGLNMVESKNKADAIKRQAEFEARQLEFNSDLIGIQKEEVERQGKKDASRRNTETKRMVGSQKASLAAQGVDVDSEVAGLLEQEERRVGLEDVETIRNNAWREAMGLEIQQADILTQAQSTRLGGKEAARQTIVAGGLGSANMALGAAGSFGGGGK